MGYKDSNLYQDLTPTLTAVALFSSLGVSYSSCSFSVSGLI